jgi:diguanylate cyclase (GGDEF)-like protein/PAS domain S-box-containing protein
LEAYQPLFVHCIDGVLFTDPETGQILAANLKACQLLGQSEESLHRLGRDGILAPEDRSRWEAARVERDQTGSFRRELSFLRGNGTTFRAEVTSTVYADAAGQARAWLMLRDVSERAAAEEALRRSEQRFRRLVETSTEAFIAMNADGLVTEWNHQAEATFGWRRDEVLGRSLADTVIPPHHRAGHTEGLARYLATGEGPALGHRLELEGRRRDGTEFPVELTIWALDAGGEVSFNALLHDISERRRLETELWELALVDELTGLHNRRSFIVLAEQAIKEAGRAGRPVIALFIDVDHLKTINDTHGHAEGDQALCRVADALRGACRSSDIIGRLSGDEFAIMLTEATDMDGIKNRIRHRLTETTEETPYPLTVSIGVARCEPTHECHLDELFERADQAMYEEKTKKRRAKDQHDAP